MILEFSNIYSKILPEFILICILKFSLKFAKLFKKEVKVTF